MAEKRDESSPFFRARPGEWSEIHTATLSEVIHLQGLLAAIVGADVERRPAPLEVALKLNEIASALFDQLAGEERDLRQIISTLRTAHAVAWDMHDAVQATRTTVEQHMEQLRATIDDFEADLKELQSRPAA
jgi:ABC-type transporter Mla subunit MlaD